MLALLISRSAKRRPVVLAPPLRPFRFLPGALTYLYIICHIFLCASLFFVASFWSFFKKNLSVAVLGHSFERYPFIWMDIFQGKRGIPGKRVKNRLSNSLEHSQKNNKPSRWRTRSYTRWNRRIKGGFEERRQMITVELFFFFFFVRRRIQSCAWMPRGRCIRKLWENRASSVYEFLPPKEKPSRHGQNGVRKVWKSAEKHTLNGDTSFSFFYGRTKCEEKGERKKGKKKRLTLQCQ